MTVFNPETFTTSLKKSLPNARISVNPHTDSERQAALIWLHAINARYNHEPMLGSGALNNLPTEETHDRNPV